MGSNVSPEHSSQDLVSWTLGNNGVDDDETIFVDAIASERSLTKRDVATLVKQLAAGFKHENGGSYLDGDVVCLHAFNDILYPALFLGIVAAGGVWTGTNPAYTAPELAHHIELSKARYIITEPEHLPQILHAADANALPHSNIFVFNPTGHLISGGLRSWEELLNHGQAQWLAFDDERRSMETPVGLFSTSGTTGLPKMAVRTHYNFVAESIALQDPVPKTYKTSRLLTVPFFHAFASPLSHVSALRDGVLTYVMRRYQHRDFLHTVSRHQITETALVPPVILKYLTCPEDEQKHLKSLKLVWCGGAPLDRDSQAAAEALFAGDARIVQVYGMTECGWICTFLYPEHDDSGSVGRLLPGFQAALLDDDDNPIHDGETRGELCVKGPMMMKAYLDNPKATKLSFTSDGWFRTGDVATVKDGKVYIVDRKKELIKVRGWQVAPAELEGTLLLHPSVADAAVIGIGAPDGTSEIPRAYVVLAPNSNAQPIAEEEIRSFLLGRLAKYKVTDCEIRFRTEIAKSPSGKILRKLLRAEAKVEEEESEQRAKASRVNHDDVPGNSSNNTADHGFGKVEWGLSDMARTVNRFCGGVTPGKIFFVFALGVLVDAWRSR